MTAAGHGGYEFRFISSLTVFIQVRISKIKAVLSASSFLPIIIGGKTKAEGTDKKEYKIQIY